MQNRPPPAGRSHRSRFKRSVFGGVQANYGGGCRCNRGVCGRGCTITDGVERSDVADRFYGSACLCDATHDGNGSDCSVNLLAQATSQEEESYFNFYVAAAVIVIVIEVS